MLKYAPIDHPCLFEMGWHPLTLDEIKAICVDQFPLSKTRNIILEGLQEIVEMLTLARVKGALWIDGSFTTKAVNPNDADIVFVCDADTYDNGGPECREVINKLITNLKSTLKCDTYVLLQYPNGHPLHTESVWNHAFYLARWG